MENRRAGRAPNLGLSREQAFDRQRQKMKNTSTKPIAYKYGAMIP
jgi:hypothetical protein